jgi:hypothetical protein
MQYDTVVARAWLEKVPAGQGIGTDVPAGQ